MVKKIKKEPVFHCSSVNLGSSYFGIEPNNSFRPFTKFGNVRFCCCSSLQPLKEGFIFGLIHSKVVPTTF